MTVIYKFARERDIREALNQLMRACGLYGEGGSEELREILSGAVGKLDWNAVEQSHREGLGYDVTWPLTEVILNELETAR